MSKPHEFLNAIDDDKIIAAIQHAEAASGVMIRVHVSHQSSIDPVKAAQRVFQKLEKRNADRLGHVLLFISPLSRTFALYGNSLAHAACGSDGWMTMTNQLAENFKTGEFTAGLLRVIEHVSDQIGHYSAASKST